MRRTRRENFLRDHLIYVIIGILVIVLLVLILGKIFGKSDNKDKSQDGKMIDTESSLDIGEVKNKLKKDTIPELTELIQQYYTAMSASDITTLEQIVSTVSNEDKDIIRRKKDYIEGYYNVTVYSKLCPVDDSYLVFASYDIKFKNEETMVPGLETFYVKTSGEGSLYIYKGDSMESEVEDFINDQLSSKTVQALFDDVNNRYVDALASSPSLLAFIEGFEGDTGLIEKAKAKAAAAASASESAQATEEPTAAPEESSAPVEESTAPAENTDTQPATDVNETVLITATVNLRSGNDEGAERLTTMIVGDQATRTGITDNGWSKVQYSGMEGYVKSDYVTTFHITSDTVKPTTTINVRMEASETANMAGQVTPDMSLTRYAECDNGWSQVQFNGGVGYVKSEFLTK